MKIFSEAYSRIYGILLVVLAFCPMLTTGKEWNHKISDNLEGNVHSTETVSYVVNSPGYSQENGKKMCYSEGLKLYNAYGNYESVTVNDVLCLVKERREYSYNKQNKITQVKTTDKNSSVMNLVIYNYDPQNRYISSTESKNNVVIENTYCKYEGNNRRIYTTITHRDDGSTATENAICQYINGRIVKEEATTTYSNNSDIELVVKTYNDSGLITINTTYENSKLRWQYVKYYDSKMRVVKWVNANFDNGYTVTEIYTYDSHNNVLSETNYYTSGAQSTRHNYNYEYDSNGNWTKKTDSNENGFSVVTYRTIKYY